MCKLIVAAALFVGRIDTPFLADGVGRIGALELDGYPSIFLKDTLAHEAHRHPFIELMGVFYLYKLRYGQHFGRRAGTTWRLIFVSALFPWLNKYRILEQDEPSEVEDLKLDVHDETIDESANDGAFEAVLPFERAHSENAMDVQRRATEPPTRPSHLMTKFQSLRHTFNDTNDASPASLNKQPTKRRLSSRASARGSLLVQQLDGAQGELQQRNAELEVKVVGLQSNIKELEAEVERLRQELGARKTKRFQSANNTDDLHDLEAKSGSQRSGSLVEDAKS
jgi:chaperonin cofactor prefoldin